MSGRISNRKGSFSNLAGMIIKTKEESRICREWSQTLRKCLEVTSGRLLNISERIAHVSYLRTFLSQRKRDLNISGRVSNLSEKVSSKLRRVSSK